MGDNPNTRDTEQTDTGEGPQADNRNVHDEVLSTGDGPQGPIANLTNTRPPMGDTPHANLNPQPMASQSGIDVNGELRIADKISLGVRGSDIVVRRSHTGQEITINSDEFQAMVQKVYFGNEQKGAKSDDELAEQNKS